ncbi:Sodium channel protein [Frankliniella fusca]|uniref:Sodium channel protein n=1 Tax=Frankliniella fusca TaxID=407009 RepID=A0AAE1GTB6_9NEOP|nr:Sodium channel protein [Frankliniella fusca]
MPLQKRHVIRLNFTVTKPASVMPFTVFYAVRTPVQLNLPADSLTELSTLLPAPPPLSAAATMDAVLDQSREWRADRTPTTSPVQAGKVFQPAPHDQKRKWGENLTTGPTGRSETFRSQRDLRVATGPTGRTETIESQRDLPVASGPTGRSGTFRSQRDPRVAAGPQGRTGAGEPHQDPQATTARRAGPPTLQPRLGLLLPPLNSPPEVEVPFQVDPCVELMVRVQLRNTAQTRRVLRRHAIIAEVHLVSPFTLDALPPEDSESDLQARAASTAGDPPPEKRPRRQLEAGAPLPADLQ